MVAAAEPQAVALPESIVSRDANTPKGVSALFRIFRFYVQQIRNGRRSSSRATGNSLAL